MPFNLIYTVIKTTLTRVLLSLICTTLSMRISRQAFFVHLSITFLECTPGWGGTISILLTFNSVPWLFSTARVILGTLAFLPSSVGRYGLYWCSFWYLFSVVVSWWWHFCRNQISCDRAVETFLFLKVHWWFYYALFDKVKRFQDLLSESEDSQIELQLLCHCLGCYKIVHVLCTVPPYTCYTIFHFLMTSFITVFLEF